MTQTDKEALTRELAEGVLAWATPSGENASLRYERKRLAQSFLDRSLGTPSGEQNAEHKGPGHDLPCWPVDTRDPVPAASQSAVEEVKREYIPSDDGKGLVPFELALERLTQRVRELEQKVLDLDPLGISTKEKS